MYSFSHHRKISSRSTQKTSPAWTPRHNQRAADGTAIASPLKQLPADRQGTVCVGVQRLFEPHRCDRRHCSPDPDAAIAITSVTTKAVILYYTCTFVPIVHRNLGKVLSDHYLHFLPRWPLMITAGPLVALFSKPAHPLLQSSAKRSSKFHPRFHNHALIRCNIDGKGNGALGNVQSVFVFLLFFLNKRKNSNFPVLKMFCAPCLPVLCNLV